jgi:uncharacterized protein YehS (DUF1456 family)
MNRNDILRRVRYIFDYNDDKMIALFAAGGLTVDRAKLSNWLKQSTHPDFLVCDENELASFLNGLITANRGKRDDSSFMPRLLLNNNTIFMKLKIALNLKAEDILEILASVNYRFGKSELSAFFRKPDHKHYRECKDQVLRTFLKGLQLKYRGPGDSSDEGFIDA